MPLALALALIVLAYLAGILTAWWERRAEERYIDEPVAYVLDESTDLPYAEHVNSALAVVDDDAEHLAWIRSLRDGGQR